MKEQEQGAGEQAGSNWRLRLRVVVLAAVGLLLLGAAAAAVRTQRIAQDRANSLSTAVAEKATAQAVAENNAQAAATCAVEASIAQETAEAERTRADQEARIALSQQLAAEAVDRIPKDLDQALLLSGLAYQTADTAQARSALLRALWYEPHLLGFLTGVGRPRGTSGEVRFGAEGTRLVAGLGGVLALWDVGSLRLLDVLDAPGVDSLDSVSIAEDGASLAIVEPGAGNLLPPSAADGMNEFWSTGSLTGTLSASVLRSTVSPDGEVLGAVGCSPSGPAYDFCELQAHLWSRTLRLQIEGLGDQEEYDEQPYLDQWYDQSGRLVGMTWVPGYGAELWDVQAKQRIAVMEAPAAVPEPLNHPYTLSRDGKLAAWSTGQSIVAWDVWNGSMVFEQDLPGTTAMRFSPDGRFLAAGGEGGSVLWLLPSGERVFESHGALWYEEQLAFSGDGQTFAAADARTIVTCRLGTSGQLPECAPLWLGGINITSIALDEDGRMLASVEYVEGPRGQLWDVSARQQLAELPNPFWGATGPAVFAPDHRLAILGTPAVLWNVDPDSWRVQACRVANRNLSLSEWEQVFGPGVPYRCVCSGLAPGEGAPENGCE